MKIIQMIYSLCSGGAEKFVVDLSNQLVQMGHDVTLCMLLDESNEKLVFNKQFLDGAVHFHSMKFGRGISVYKVSQVENYIKREAPDVVHCHLNVIPYIFRLALCRRHIKFFHTLHSVAENASGTKMQRLINRFFYKHNIIKPVCISKLCQQSYQQFYKLFNAPYIDNGRAMIGASLHFESVKEEVSLYKKTSDSMVFIHVARFDAQKNQGLLIKAFNRLSQEGYDFILLVIGTGYDSTEGEKLKQQACEKIFFLGEKNNVNDYLLCSDAFCLTSKYEGLPISLLEALSCGVTPICTAVGGIPDVITDGVNGYLSKEGTIEAYCGAIRRFWNKPIVRSKLIDYFKANYSMEVCARKYEKLYKYKS